MTSGFEQSGVDPFFIKRLQDRNINKATDIQRKVISRLAAGESVFFTSATGTGKTFAYLLPFLNKLLEKPLCEDTDNAQAIKDNPRKQRRESGVNPYFVIIAPTLELCTQIKGELDFLLEGTNIRSSLLIGSVNLERQIELLKKTKPDIVVGNPNRLLVLAKKRLLKLNPLFLVLDEADRLVNDELIDDISELLKLIKQNSKKNVITAACSATINNKSREKLLTICGGSHIPFIVSEDNEILKEMIEHWAIFSEKRRKDQTLRSLLSALKTKKGKKTKVKALIFTSRSDEAGFILSRLQHHHISAAGLFGKAGKKPIPSQERKAALDSFRQGSIEALVSTDLAARGLDIPGITHVIALDVPSDKEIYIHRCGRTGRAGKRGIMITIGDETQMHLLASLEKKLKIRIQPKELHYGQVCIPAPITEED
jgi:superfamily II DNA/RNA helicase